MTNCQCAREKGHYKVESSAKKVIMESDTNRAG